MLFLLALISALSTSNGAEVLNCSGLDNGRVSDNPVYREPLCYTRCDACSACAECPTSVSSGGGGREEL